MHNRSLKSARLSLLWMFPVTAIAQYIASNIFNYAGILLPVLYVWVAIYLAHNATENTHRTVRLPRYSLLPLGFVLLYIISKFRTYQFDSSILSITNLLYTVMLYSGVYLLAKVWAKSPELGDISTYLVRSYFLYFALNVVLWAAGLTNPSAEKAYSSELEPLFAFLSERQMLPLSQDISDSSICAMLGGVCALLLYKGLGLVREIRLWEKVMYLIVCIMGGVTILLGGNRLPLLLFFFICFYVVTKLHKHKKITISVSVALFLFPFLYLLLFFPLSESGILEYLEFFSRTGNPLEILLLNNRVIIWMVEGLHFLNEAGYKDFLFGYGYYGQTISGIVYDYMNIFGGSYEGVETISVHSSILQIIINMGLIGAFLVIIIIITFLQRVFLLDAENARTGALIMLMALIGTSMIEVQLATDCQAFLFFILLTTYYLSLPEIDFDAPVIQIPEECNVEETA